MKKRIAILLLAFVLFLFACGQQAPTWQEQYDLGVRYLSEGNYQEAIIAFTAAIEIDSKRSEAYLGTAKAYVEAGSAGKASEILQQGYEKTQDQALLDAIESQPGDEGRGSSQADPAGLTSLEGYPKTERIEYLSGNGYLILEYDLYGRPSFEESYTSENILDGRRTWEYDDQGRLLTEFSEQFGDYSDASAYYSTNQHYNENHQLVEEVRYDVTSHANNGYPSTTIITYQYLGTQVEIFVTDTTPETGETYHGTFSYAMEAPENYVRVTGLAGGIEVIGITEYRLEKMQTPSGWIEIFPEIVKDLDFDSDGNVIDYSEY